MAAKADAARDLRRAMWPGPQRREMTTKHFDEITEGGNLGGGVVIDRVLAAPSIPAVDTVDKRMAKAGLKGPADAVELDERHPGAAFVYKLAVVSLPGLSSRYNRAYRPSRTGLSMIWSVAALSLSMTYPRAENRQSRGNGTRLAVQSPTHIGATLRKNRDNSFNWQRYAKLWKAVNA